MSRRAHRLGGAQPRLRGDFAARRRRRRPRRRAARLRCRFFRLPAEARATPASGAGKSTRRAGRIPERRAILLRLVLIPLALPLVLLRGSTCDARRRKFSRRPPSSPPALLPASAGPAVDGAPLPAGHPTPQGEFSSPAGCSPPCSSPLPAHPPPPAAPLLSSPCGRGLPCLPPPAGAHRGQRPGAPSGAASSTGRAGATTPRAVHGRAQGLLPDGARGGPARGCPPLLSPPCSPSAHLVN